MYRWKNSLFNISLALNCLLLFLLIFENRLVVPLWLQVAGRTHPLILHFPVVLVVLYALTMLVFVFRKGQQPAELKDVTQVLLLLAAFTSVITALAGLFLSREEGYDAEALQWHKWSGAFVSFFTLGWYYFSGRLHGRRLVSLLTSVLAIIVISFAGHQGAGITHGQNFLLAPMLPEKKEPAVSAEEAIVFAHMVKPIFRTKCESCHNDKKAKGDLVMETEELLLKGGKSGKLWDSTAADLGLLLRRVHLPLEAKKHMPPQGKPQLTQEEIEIITHWIRKGANFKLRVTDLAPEDTLRQIAQKIFTAAEIAEYDFDEADPATVESLNSQNRVVLTESLGSPALTVSFFNSSLFNQAQLKELSKIKKQVVTLDLARMPVKDDDMRLITDFENLRRLNLSFTNITGATIGELKKLKYLKSLSVSGTKINAQQLKELQSFPALKTVYAWNVAAPATDMDALRQTSTRLRYEAGFRGDTMMLKLSPPVLLNEERIITSSAPLKLKHYIQGVTMRYTMDGSEPDSLKSPVFKGGETISHNIHLKVKAFKPGWISSDVLEASFLKSTYTPDTVIYLVQPNEKYRDEKGKLLVNHEKGEPDFRFGGWVAFRENKMDCLLRLAQPATVKSVTMSSLVDPGSYIMPAERFEVWGGPDEKQMKLLARVLPDQPQKIQSSFTKGIECTFDPVTVKYIRIVGIPVTRLPSWHPGKGEKGWIFVDEILLN